MIELHFNWNVLKTVEVIKKKCKLGFVFSQIIAETVGFREKVFVVKTNISSCWVELRTYSVFLDTKFGVNKFWSKKISKSFEIIKKNLKQQSPKCLW